MKKFDSQLKALGKTVDIHIFPDAGHAFENPNNKTGYRADDAAEAWKLTVAFLAKNLKYARTTFLHPFHDHGDSLANANTHGA